MLSHLKLKSCVIVLLGGIILAFGLYHIHSFSGVTEGGILGATLLLHYWFGISPSLSGLILNAACYIIGLRLLGRKFIAYSLIAGGGFSAAYAIFEQFDPLWPQLAEMPLAAAILGALFVGVGCGLCVRMGGAPSGDDALAMALSDLLHCRIQWMYLITDAVVLLMSISYIPITRLAYSVLTVLLSGQLVGWIQRLELPARRI